MIVRQPGEEIITTTKCGSLFKKGTFYLTNMRMIYEKNDGKVILNLPMPYVQ